MKTHVDAIKALLVATGFHVYVTDPPPGAPPMRIIINAPTFLTRPLTVSGAEVIDDFLQIKGTGATDAECRRAQEAARTALNRKKVIFSGWEGWLTLRASSPNYPDRDVTLPDTNTRIIASVDTYHYRSTPA